MDVPPSHIHNTVHGLRPITVDTAMRLALFFNVNVRFWLNLQAEYDAQFTEKHWVK